MKKLKLKKCLLIIVIWCLLGITRIMILTIPFKKVAAIMGKSKEEAIKVLTERDQRRAKKLGNLISYVSNYTPWDSKCFVQALTGLMLLSLFKIPSTIYFGIRKQQTNRLLAHAWLRAGEQVITGDEERRYFIPVAKYAKHIKSY
ncbi:MAG: hypothetical protein CVV02_09160 [Firmicutes bacterium HGW-Firmicutes-7]|nr:MAG: hypothetical protein CVV02_09160 [Firmicutes bacterium HGW-Firmicutes-7]